MTGLVLFILIILAFVIHFNDDDKTTTDKVLLGVFTVFGICTIIDSMTLHYLKQKVSSLDKRVKVFEDKSPQAKTTD